MCSPDVTTDQFRCGVCDGPATTSPPAKIVSFDGEAGVDDGGIVQRTAATKHSAAMNRECMSESYRNSRFARVRCPALPMRVLFAAAALAAATTAFADGRF